MPHKYRVTVQPIDGGSNAHAGDALTFDIANHDDLLDITSRIRGLNVLPEGEVAEFAIGLKLFTEVLIRHRREPLFEALWVDIGRFMKRLKALGATGAAR